MSGRTVTVFYDYRTMYDDAVYFLALPPTVIPLRLFCSWLVFVPHGVYGFQSMFISRSGDGSARNCTVRTGRRLRCTFHLLTPTKTTMVVLGWPVSHPRRYDGSHSACQSVFLMGNVDSMKTYHVDHSC